MRTSSQSAAAMVLVPKRATTASLASHALMSMLRLVLRDLTKHTMTIFSLSTPPHTIDCNLMWRLETARGVRSAARP